MFRKAMFQKAIIFTTLLVFSFSAARADEASKKARIHEMFTILKLDSMMKQVMQQSFAQGEQTARSMFGDRPMTEDEKKLVNEFSGKMLAVISETLSWEKLEPAYIDLYASAYSEEEIDGIIAFYKSPVGQTMLAKTPELLTKSTQIVSAQMQELAPKMRALVEEMIKQNAAAHPEAKPTN